MKITKWKVENFMGIESADIVMPDEPVIPITGANESGKSSFLDSLWAALDAAALRKAGITKPVHDGSSVAKIEVDFEGLVVSRTIDGDGKTLSLKVRQGRAEYQGAQSMLDKLTGKAIDPKNLLEISGTKRVEFVLECLGKQDVIAKLKKQTTEIVAQREAFGREVKRLKAIAGEPVPVFVEIDLNRIQAEQEQRRSALTRLKALTEAVATQKSEIARLERALLDANEKLGAMSLEISTLLSQWHSEKYLEEEIAKSIAATQEAVNVAAKKAKAEQINSAKQELGVAQAKWDGCQNKLSQLSEQLKSQMKTDIPGLEITEDDILFNKIPLSQLKEGSAGIKVSLMLAAKSLEPDGIRVLRMKGGESLDSNGWKWLREFASENNVMVVIEKMSETGEKDGIHMTEGKPEIIA